MCLCVKVRFSLSQADVAVFAQKVVQDELLLTKPSELEAMAFARGTPAIPVRVFRALPVLTPHLAFHLQGSS